MAGFPILECVDILPRIAQESEAFALFRQPAQKHCGDIVRRMRYSQDYPHMLGQMNLAQRLENPMLEGSGN